MLAENNPQREAMNDTRQPSQLLLSVVDCMSEGVIIASPEGHLLYWNRAALLLHDLEDSAAWSKQLADFTKFFELSTITGEVLQFEDWPMSRILRGECLNNLELKIRRIDASWRRVMNYGGQVITDNTGRRLAFLTITDITERKQAEIALTDYNERLKILRQIDVALIAGDAPGTIAKAVLPLIRDLLRAPRVIVNLFNLQTG